VIRICPENVYTFVTNGLGKFTGEKVIYCSTQKKNEKNDRNLRRRKGSQNNNMSKYILKKLLNYNIWHILTVRRDHSGKLITAEP
jgi:hypothetical protein